MKELKHSGSNSSLANLGHNNKMPSLANLKDSNSKRGLQIDYPVHTQDGTPIKKANIHLKELSYFLKVLDTKVRFDAQLNEGLPVQMRHLEELFLELNYSLSGQQLNELFLKQFQAGRCFQSGRGHVAVQQLRGQDIRG